MTSKGPNKTEDLMEAYVQTMKNATRASIVFHLARKPEMTATELARVLGEDVDVIYYHMKFLRKLGLVSEPRVEVRGNYLEKYYSLMPEMRKSSTEADKSYYRKLKEMDPEEYRKVLLTSFALLKSVVAGSANQIERAGANALNSLKKKRNLVVWLIYCNKELYYELLNDVKKIVKTPDQEKDSGEKGYNIALLAMPKLDEE